MPMISYDVNQKNNMKTRKNKIQYFFRNKSSWQKDECLFCENVATLECIFKQASIRCCTNENCKRKAISFAIISFDSDKEIFLFETPIDVNKQFEEFEEMEIISIKKYAMVEI